MNVARVGSLLAGIPHEVPAATMNRVCTSGMEAIQTGYLQIIAGYSDVVIAGGVESMSNAPFVVPSARWGKRLGDDILVCASHSFDCHILCNISFFQPPPYTSF